MYGLVYKGFPVSPINLVLHMLPPANIASLCNIWFMYHYFEEYCIVLQFLHKYNRWLTSMHAFQFVLHTIMNGVLSQLQSSIIYIYNILTLTSTKRVLVLTLLSNLLTLLYNIVDLLKHCCQKTLTFVKFECHQNRATDNITSQ